MQGARVQSLVWELSSHVPHSMPHLSQQKIKYLMLHRNLLFLAKLKFWRYFCCYLFHFYAIKWVLSNQSILKEISPGISLEGMMLKLKLQYFGHLMWRVDLLEKALMLGGIGGQEEKGTTEDEMAGWYHWLNGRESEWTPGVGDGQGGLACCDSWGCKESDMTERLIWSDLKRYYKLQRNKANNSF